MFRLANRKIVSSRNLNIVKNTVQATSVVTVSTQRNIFYLTNTRNQTKCKNTIFSDHSPLLKCLFTSDARVLNELDYEKYCAETLEALTDYFDELVESSDAFTAADVVYKDGVLTVVLGSSYGTYVINKQTPNKQIWLSSPKSGPKRYDFVHASGEDNKKLGCWYYKHTGKTLHELLDDEFSKIARTETKFHTLPFGAKC